MAYLKVVGGPQVGQILTLRSSGTLLGRLPECDISVRDLEVSRRHARFSFSGGQCHVEDLGSRNGTFVNERRVCKPTPLGEGDRVRVVKMEFLYHDGDPYETWDQRRCGETLAAAAGEDVEASARLEIARDGSPNHGTNRSLDSLVAETKALLEITTRLRSTLSLDEVLPQILETLVVVFPAADRGFIALRDDEGNVAMRWIREWHGGPAAARSVSRTIIRRVLETGKAILSADAAADQQLTGIDSLKASGLHSLMCVPLTDAHGKAFGVLQLDTSSEQSRFHESNLEVLVAVAAQASIAIENARLYEEVLQQRGRERDRDLAEHIQRSFLPKSRPCMAGYEFYDFYQPASQVGGDFYTYVPLPDGRLGVVVADVSGHGLAAAMLTARLAAEFPPRLLTAQQPANAVAQLNAVLTHELLEDYFITLLLAVLEPDSGWVTLVNAGHVAPMLRSASGDVSEIGGPDHAGFPIGIDEQTSYEAVGLRLARGDVLLLYSDGITDAVNTRNETYSKQRLVDQLRLSRGGAREAGLAIVDDVREFTAGCLPFDDMCLTTLGRR